MGGKGEHGETKGGCRARVGEGFFAQSIDGKGNREDESEEDVHRECGMGDVEGKRRGTALLIGPCEG